MHSLFRHFVIAITVADKEMTFKSNTVMSGARPHVHYMPRHATDGPGNPHVSTCRPVYLCVAATRPAGSGLSVSAYALTGPVPSVHHRNLPRSPGIRCRSRVTHAGEARSTRTPQKQHVRLLSTRGLCCVVSGTARARRPRRATPVSQHLCQLCKLVLAADQPLHPPRQRVPLRGKVGHGAGGWGTSTSQGDWTSSGSTGSTAQATAR